MAPRKPTDNVAKQATVGENTAPIVSEESENEKLKRELEEMKQMMQELLKTKTETKVQEEVPVIKKSLFSSAEEKYDIDPKTYFPITSLTYGGLNLRGLHNVFTIPDFGQSISVSFEDLRAIHNNHPIPTKEGMFLIKNETAVKALSLEKYYEKFINEDMILNFMKLSVGEIKEILFTTTDVLKRTIVETVINGVINGDDSFMDRNKVKLIGDLVGLDIYAQVNQIESNQ